MTNTIPLNESHRIRAIKEFQIYNNHVDQEILDEILVYAAELTKCTHSAISVVNKKEVEFLATLGMKTSSYPREYIFCSQAISVITSSDPNFRLFEIPDTHKHDHFKNTPFVQTYPYLRSYLSYTLQISTSLGPINLGTLCVCNTQARSFTSQEKFDLKILGELTNKLLTGEINVSQ
jgi:GAF domain-containing protein